MAFYSESEGYYPSSVTPTTQEGNVSLVGYMINSNNQLVRLCRGLTWSGVNTGVTTSVVYNPVANSPTYSSVTSNTISGNSATSGYNASTWPLVATGNDPYYQVIGDQVFRLEYTFLVQSSRTSATSGQTTAYYSDSPWNTTDSTPNGLQDVTAVVVTIAVLDTKSRAMVSATALQTAAADLPDSAFTTPTAATTATSLPLPNWEAALAANNLGLPQAVASQVRFYQRFCYLNHLQ